MSIWQVKFLLALTSNPCGCHCQTVCIIATCCALQMVCEEQGEPQDTVGFLNWYTQPEGMPVMTGARSWRAMEIRNAVYAYITGMLSPIDEGE